MQQMQKRLMCGEHNIETLRTRLTQVADLRDAQGIREDHRTIVARLDEVEEYASANYGPPRWPQKNGDFGYLALNLAVCAYF